MLNRGGLGYFTQGAHVAYPIMAVYNVIFMFTIAKSAFAAWLPDEDFTLLWNGQ